MIKENIWLLGTGYMAIEYAKVLKDLGCTFTTIGRGDENCQKFEKEVGIKPISGGIKEFLLTNPQIPNAVINAAGIDLLSETTHLLLDFGVKYILLEKPGFGSIDEFEPLYQKALNKKVTILLAYNRRFYASVQHALKMIENDGGAKSMVFDFTEWSHVIGSLAKSKVEHNNWFYGNSTHLIDLAFFMCGTPKIMHCHVSGQNKINWHPHASIFSGSGITEQNVLFSYHANWAGPGRWGIDIITGKNRYIYKPLEKLHMMALGSVAINLVEDIDYSLDEKFKPGIYLQTQKFLNNELENFCDIERQWNLINFYNQIIKGN
jgi:predicted dehydrogenase